MFIGLAIIGVSLAGIGGFTLGGTVAAILAVPAVASLTVLHDRHYETRSVYRNGWQAYVATPAREGRAGVSMVAMDGLEPSTSRL